MIPEIISSGLTHSVKDGLAGIPGGVVSIFSGLLFGDVLKESGHMGRHFAELDIDLTSEEEPAVRPGSSLCIQMRLLVKL